MGGRVWGAPGENRGRASAMRLLLAKLVAAACLLIACVLYASPEHLESSVRMEQLLPLRGGVPSADVDEPEDGRSTMREAHRALRRQRRHLRPRTSRRDMEVRRPTMLEERPQRSQPVWEQPVHLSNRQSAQLKLMANKMLVNRLHKKLESQQSNAESQEDVEVGIKGKQQIIDLNETIMEDKETLESSNSLKDVTVKQVVKEGAEVRLAKEYNQLALAKYHVEHAEKYKEYGQQLYAQAKMDAAQSIKLKDSAKAKAVTAKDLFDSAGLSRLGLDEAQNQLSTDLNQAKKVHDVTKQKLMVAQTHFKTGTKDKALFHYWATKSNSARSHAYERIDRAHRLHEQATETRKRIEQLLDENKDLESVVRK